MRPTVELIIVVVVLAAAEAAVVFVVVVVVVVQPNCMKRAPPLELVIDLWRGCNFTL